MAAMLLGLLVCSDPECEAVYEASCEEYEFDGLACEDCGCALQVVAVSNASENGALPRGVDLQRRDAA